MGEHKRPRPQIQIRAQVFVATPTYSGQVTAECASSMQIATLHCFTRGIVLDWQFAPGFSLVQHGRNWLNSEFLSRADYTHLLWLDDDVAFEPDAIAKMIERDKDAVAGVYTTKHPKNPSFPYEALGPVNDGLQEARKVPGGFLLLKRKVVETISDLCDVYMLTHNGVTRKAAHMFDVLMIDSDNFPGEKELLGEDFVLCYRLIEYGYKIFVETDINFAHYGRFAWLGNLAETLKKEAEAGITGQGSEIAHDKNNKMQDEQEKAQVA